MTALSPERVGRITGSRVAKILGLSPYGDRDSALREMVRERLGAPPEFLGNIATDYGKDNEPAATAEYERYRGVMVHADQHFVVHRSIDYLGCTPDGLIGETGMAQIKCPFRATYTTLDERPDYAAQIQLELAVLDREWSDFVVWRPSGLAVTRTGRDPGWLDANLPTLDLFIADYEDAVHDVDRHRDFLEDTETVPVRDDFDWQIAALEFLEAKAAHERAEKTREAARARLIELAAGQPARGAGVAVSIADRKASEYVVRQPAKTVTTVRAAS